MYDYFFLGIQKQKRKDKNGINVLRDVEMKNNKGMIV